MYKIKIVSKYDEPRTAEFKTLQEVAAFIRGALCVDSLAELVKMQKESQVRIYLTHKNK